MLTGYNTDIRHEGIVYHVQTEDGGEGNPVIVSLVYQGGRILASRRTSYAKLLGTDGLPVQLRSLLEKQHKEMIQAIQNGTLGAVPGAGSTQGPAGVPPPGRPESQGHQKPAAEDRAAQSQAGTSEKNLDQVILEYLASEIEND